MKLILLSAFTAVALILGPLFFIHYQEMPVPTKEQHIVAILKMAEYSRMHKGVYEPRVVFYIDSVIRSKHDDRWMKTWGSGM